MGCRSCSSEHSMLDEVEDLSTGTEAAAPGMGMVGQAELHDVEKEQVGLHGGMDSGQRELLAAAVEDDILDEHLAAVVEDDTQDESQAVAESDEVQTAVGENGIQIDIEIEETVVPLYWAAEHAKQVAVAVVDLHRA